MLNTEKQGRVVLALSGRVPIKVSRENGSINRGDPIVASDIDGVGMKATKSGMIIGRAMEDFNADSDVSNCGNTKCGKVTALLTTTWWEPRWTMLHTLSLVSAIGWVVIAAAVIFKKMSKRTISRKPRR